MQKFWGKVRKNKGRGKSLGFPTANLRLSKPISEGIYLSNAKVDKKIYPALTFIGTAKTFGENKFQAEVYLLNIRKNLYGKWLSVALLKKIRENKKFPDELRLDVIFGQLALGKTDPDENGFITRATC